MQNIKCNLHFVDNFFSLAMHLVPFLVEILPVFFLVVHSQFPWEFEGDPEIIEDVSFKHDKWRYPAVDMWDLISCFDSKHCLVIIDNRQHVDILHNPLAIPVIIRSLVALQIEHKQDEITGMLGPATLAKRVLPTTFFETIVCPFSELFLEAQIRNFEAMCLSLDMNRFWRHSKTWNCRVQIALFPDNLYYKGYAKFDWLSVHEMKVLDYPFIFPNTFADSIQIFVHEDKPLVDNYQPNTLNEIVKVLLQDSFRVDFCGKIFIHAKLKITSGSSPGQALERSGSIISSELRLIRVCHQLAEMDILPAPDIRPRMITDFQMLARLVLPLEKFNLAWKIVKNDRGEHVVPRMLQIMLNCEHNQAPPHLWTCRGPVQCVAQGYSSVWFSLMGNFTIVDHGGYPVCEKNMSVSVIHEQILLNLHSYARGYFYFPYFFRDELTHLRFISCGEKGLLPLSFQELTNIFDKWIWLGIGILLATIVSTLMYLTDNRVKFWSYWISPLKVFLEQGDPFLEGVASGSRTRLVVAIFLLIGIILSNAYKNTNVYNMIIPRKPVLYEEFSDLIKDNFTILTRITSIRPWILPFSEDFLKTVPGSYVYFESIKVGMAVYSEIYVYMYTLKNTIQTFYEKEFEIQNLLQNSSLRRLGILNVSTLMPSVTPLLGNLRWNKTLENTSKFMEFYKYWEDEASPTEIQRLMTSEFYDFQKTLKLCNKVAVLLPEYICQNVSKNLKKESNLKSISIGTESISDVEWLFRLKGVIPPTLPRKIKSVYESGLWERWWKLIKIKDSEAGNELVAAAKMDGNIIIIFSLWICGICGSFAFIVLEIIFSTSFRLGKYCWVGLCLKWLVRTRTRVHMY